MEMGGVLFRGSLTKKVHDLGDNLDISPIRKAEGEALKAGALKELKKRQEIKDLGKSLKENLKGNIHDEEKHEEGGFYRIAFIKPNRFIKEYIAKSKDYTVVMHFNEQIRNKINFAGGISEAKID